MSWDDPDGRTIKRALDQLWKSDPARQARILRAFRETTERKESKPAAWLAGGASVGLAVVIVLTLNLTHFALRGPETPVRAPAAAPVHGRLFTILADNHLLAYDDGTHDAAWSVQLASPPKPGRDGYGYLPTGHYLAVSADQSLVYALPLSGTAGALELDVVEASSGRVIRRHSFAGTSTHYGTVALGPRSGRVYLVGQGDAGLTLTVLDPQGDRVVGMWPIRSMDHWTARGLAPGDFFIYQATITPDESRIYFDYYGARLDLSGIDWVNLGAQPPRACTPSIAGAPCIRAYAGFRLMGSEIIVTDTLDTRLGQLAMVPADGGQATKRFSVSLVGFVTDFELDMDKQRLYIVGSCGYRGGLAQVDLTSGQSTMVAALGPIGSVDLSRVCGQRTALRSASELLVGQVAGLLASASRGGSILRVDTDSGVVRERLSTPSEPLDLAVAR